MAEAIATAYVDIKPQIQGFQKEATAGINRNLQNVGREASRLGGAATSANRDIGRFNRGVVAANASVLGFGRAMAFASTAFLGGAGLGALIRTATHEFSEMTRVGATTNALVRATGGIANVTAGQVRQLSQALLDQTGVDDEVIASGANVLLTFRKVRNEVGAGNQIFDRAIKASLDLSTVFRQDVSSSAIQLGKALEDPVRGVQALRRSGVSFTSEQQKLLKSLVATGQTLRAQRLILGEVERQVGGTAKAVGDTLPGQLDKLRERAVNALGEYARRLAESEDAADLARIGLQAFTSVFNTLVTVVKAVGPPLASAARFAAKLADALDPTAVLAAVAAYKSFGIVVAAAGQAQQLATRALVVGEAAQHGATAATAAHASVLGTYYEATGAVTHSLELTRRTTEAYRGVITTTAAAQAGLTASTTAEVAALDAAGVSGARIVPVYGAMGEELGVVAVTSNQAAVGMGRLAAAEGAAGAAAVRMTLAQRAAAGAVGGLRIAVSALGGPIGILAIAVGALAFGLLQLKKRAEEAPGTLRHATKAFGELNDFLERGQDIRNRVAESTQTVIDRQAAVAEATKRVAAANKALEATTASPGSLLALSLTDKLAVARSDLAQATKDLAAAERSRDRAADLQTKHEKDRVSVIAATTKRFREDIIGGGATGLEVQAVGNLRGQLGADIEKNARLLRAEVTRLTRDLLGNLAKETEIATSKAAKALLVLTDTLRRAPTDTEIKIAVTGAAQGRTLAAIIEQLRIGVGLTREMSQAESAIEAVRAHRVRTAAEENRALQERVAALQDLLQKERKRRDAVADVVKQRKAEHQTAVETRRDAAEALESARRSLTDSRQALTDANRALADAVRSTRDSVTDAVNAAKQNLRSLVDTIAEALGKLGESGTVVTAEQRKRIAELRRQVIAGGGGPDTQRAAQAIQAEIAAQQRQQGDNKAKQRLADLANAFNFGRINAEAFNRGLTRLLKTFGLNIAEFRRKFGPAAADELVATIRAARAQVAASAAGPQRPGGGIEPEIVKPIEAVREGRRQIADATRNVAEAARGIDDATRDVRHAERDFGKASRDAALAAIRLRRANERLERRQAEVDATRAKLEKTPRARIDQVDRLNVGQAGPMSVTTPRVTVTAQSVTIAGPQTGRAGGGTIPGVGSTDTVPAMLTPGEIVLNAGQQRRLRGMLGLGSGSPDQLFRAVRGYQQGGVAGHDPIERLRSTRETRGGERIPLGFHGFLNTIWHSGARTYRLNIAGRPLIPLRRDAEGFFSEALGRGLSRAKWIDALDWWSSHWPAQLRYAAGGVAGRIPLGFHTKNKTILHSGRRLYRFNVRGRPEIPLRRDVSAFLTSRGVGHPFFPANVVEALDWWQGHWPAQQRFGSGGVVRRLASGGVARPFSTGYQGGGVSITRPFRSGAAVSITAAVEHGLAQLSALTLQVSREQLSEQREQTRLLRSVDRKLTGRRGGEPRPKPSGAAASASRRESVAGAVSP